jgi:hypothetical protein
MRADNYLKLSTVETFSSPFHYFTSPEVFKPEVADIILEWFETRAPWRLVVADFYEQYEFSFWDVDLPLELTFLIQRSLVEDLRMKISRIFNTELSDEVDIAAHKLISGQRIRLHNDFRAGQETHRLLIQLNRGWADHNGGLLILFNSSQPSDIHKIFRPIHNSALAFAVSPKSHHAVSAISANQRFTLVYSFYGNKRDA